MDTGTLLNLGCTSKLYNAIVKEPKYWRNFQISEMFYLDGDLFDLLYLHGHKTKTFAMRGSKYIIHPYTVPHIIDFMPNLSTLVLSGCKLISDLQFLNTLPSLVNLELDKVENVESHSFHTNVPKCTKLAFISMKENNQIDKYQLVTMAKDCKSEVFGCYTFCIPSSRSSSNYSYQLQSYGRISFQFLLSC